MRTERYLIALLAVAAVFAFVSLAAEDEGKNPPPGGERNASADEQASQDTSTVKKPDGVTIDPAWQLKPDNIPFAGGKDAEIWKMPALSDNLVLNGSYEQGKYWPYDWEPPDGLGSYWQTGDATDGKRFIRMDTLVVQEGHWLPQNEKVLLLYYDLMKKTGGKPQSVPTNPLPKPPAKVYDTAPYYGSVGGNLGVHYKGPFFKCVPGAIYRVIVDARCDTIGGGGAFVWFKGFMDETRKMEGGTMTLKRNAWRCQCKLHGLSKEWRRFAWLGHPARSKSTFKGKPVQPEWLQGQLYAYWGPGIYDWDNLRIDIVGYEDVQVGEDQAAPKKPKTAPAKRMEGDFPVF